MDDVLIAHSGPNSPQPDGPITLGGLARDPKTFLFLGVFIAVFVAVFSDFFLSGRLFYARDMAGLEIPMRRHIVDLMKEGRLPLWTEAYGNGQPVLANPKWAIFYPATWLYLLLSFPVAFKFHFLFHALAAWLGIFALGRSLRLSSVGAFLGASSFLLGGFYLSSIEFYNHVAAFAWLPWILFALRGRAPKARRSWLALIGLWCLLILAGAPHFVPMAALFVLLTVPLAGDRKAQRLGVAFLTFAAALLICAVQLVPSAELLRGKSRDPAETLRWSLEPIQLLNLAVPGILGSDRGSDTAEFWGRHLFDKGYPLYCSLYASPGLLILVLLGLRRPRDRIRALLLGGFGLFFVLSALRLFPFFSLLAKVPGLGLIRYPVNYFGGALLCLSLLAACGFESCRKPLKPDNAILAGALPLSLAAVAAFFLWRARLLHTLAQLFIIDDASQISALEGSIRRSLIITAVFVGLLLAARLVRRGAPALLGLFAGLLILDLAISNKEINPTAPARFYDLPAVVSAAEGPVRIYRDPSLPVDLTDRIGFDLRYQRYLRSSLFPYTEIGPVQYVYDRDFFSLYSDDQRAVHERLKRTGPETRRRILADARCDYAVSHRPLLGNGADPVIVEGEPVYFDPVPKVLERPYFAGRIVRIDTFEEALALFEQAGFDPSATAIVYDDLGPDVGPVDRSGSLIAVSEAGEGRLGCSLSTPRAALAVLPVKFDAGWTVRLDGRRITAFKAGLASTGIVVPPGTHEVTAQYAPASLCWGGGLSLVALAGIVLFAFLNKRPD